MAKIVIDMMGGDNGLNATIEASYKFINENKEDLFILVGDSSKLGEFSSFNNVKIVNATKIVAMDAEPLDVLKDKESSLMIATKELLDNDYDAILSAGSTGGLVAVSTLKIGRIKGIKHPALISALPTKIDNKKVVVLDLGAFTDIESSDLISFAKLGKVYYSIIFNKENPTIYQLNNGTESHKGKKINQETFKSLKEDKSLNFKGNIEGRDALNGECDVVVTDGFSGNIFLKTVEGTAKLMSNMLKDAFKSTLFTKIGYLLLRKEMKKFKNKMDYKGVGGAMLLGVNKIVVKAHGSSDAKAFYSALKQTKKLSDDKLIEKIKEEIA